MLKMNVIFHIPLLCRNARASPDCCWFISVIFYLHHFSVRGVVLRNHCTFRQRKLKYKFYYMYKMHANSALKEIKHLCNESNYLTC